MLHKGVSATAVYAGASYDTAERVATYADISTIALGGFSSYKSLSNVGSASQGARVFWSGGQIAKTEAAAFAKAEGMITLEMTKSGSFMNSLSPYLPRFVSSPIWDKLSLNFAKGASGEINVFQNAAGVSLKSTWRRIEYPIVKNQNIIYHT
ncbi:MAG: hemolysin precursor, partial [Bacteroidota bacterium]